MYRKTLAMIYPSFGILVPRKEIYVWIHLAKFQQNPKPKIGDPQHQYRIPIAMSTLQKIWIPTVQQIHFTQICAQTTLYCHIIYPQYICSKADSKKILTFMNEDLENNLISCEVALQCQVQFSKEWVDNITCSFML